MPAMSEESSGSERRKNLWAPWRMEYIRSLSPEQDKGCFLCRSAEHPENDESNFVLWRGPRTFAMLNRFPYTGGHALVAPYEHIAELADIDAAAMREMMEMLRDLQAVLARAIRAQGFNIGINLGRCAGAGLPGHLHAHIVPRWSGDTNFMTVLDDVRVIPQALDELCTQLRAASGELDLPNLSE